MKIYTFDPVIYPVRLWLGVGTENPEGFKVDDYIKDSAATAAVAKDLEHDLEGVMIRFLDAEQLTARNISHEAVHAAMEIYDFIGGRLTYADQEPFCYLVGWIAECCESLKQEVETDEFEI